MQDTNYTEFLRDKLKYFVSKEIISPVNVRLLYQSPRLNEIVAEIIDRIDGEKVYALMTNELSTEPTLDEPEMQNPPPEPIFTTDFDKDFIKLVNSSMKAAFAVNTPKLINSVGKHIKLTNLANLEFEANRRSGYLKDENKSLKTELGYSKQKEDELWSVIEDRDVQVDFLQQKVAMLRKRLAHYEPIKEAANVITDDEIKDALIDYKRFAKDDLKYSKSFIVLEYATRVLGASNNRVKSREGRASKLKYFVKVSVGGGHSDPIVILAGSMLAKLVGDGMEMGLNFIYQI